MENFLPLILGVGLLMALMLTAGSPSTPVTMTECCPPWRSSQCHPWTEKVTFWGVSSGWFGSHLNGQVRGSDELSLLIGDSSWTLARLYEPDSTDLQPSSVLTSGNPELTDASLGFLAVPSEAQHLLVSNGHLPKVCDSSPESTPLTGQFPGTRRGPLLLAPKS
jgi:hypothetical protein